MAFPEEFIRRIEHQPDIDTKSLLKSLEEPSPVSIRINDAKWDHIPLNAGPVAWCKNGYYLGSRPSFTLDPLFHCGCYYPQEASSMFLEQAIVQTSGSADNIRVLDLCGAPGGKSTHLSDLIGRNNLLVSNEVIRSRSLILSETITKWGHGNTIVTQNDPAAFGKLNGYFDVVVVDAPCSGEGMFRNPAAVREWSVANAVLCSERQKRILMDIWPSLKQNGLLVYSTCTFNPGENEENIKWLIKKNKAECVRLDISGFPGIKEIDSEGIYGYGFYPGKIRGEGFFITVIRKKDVQEELKIKSQKRSQYTPGKKETEVAGLWSSFSKDRIIRWGDELIGVPCSVDDYLVLFNNLRIAKPGTKLFSVKQNNYLPSHELALSRNLTEEAFPGEELSYPEAVSYLRRDNLRLNKIVKGWNLVKYRGVSLGFVNNLGNRLNNYFPMDWRIKMNPTGEEKITEWDGQKG